MRALSLRLTSLLVVAIACDSSTSIDQPVTSAAARGQLAFSANCASCHASSDGFDLAFFNFSDTTIIRRALKHVDRGAADDIVAYIHTLTAVRHNREERPFQPGNTVLASDAAFGQALFPGDVFPENLTTAQLRALDPLTVRVALALPRWSVENTNTDWMPDVALPTSILADQDSAPARLLATYRQSPTQNNLLNVMRALFSAMQRNNSPGPCHFESMGRQDFLECFQAERWAASLVAQHMLRNGLTTALPDTSFHNMWWEAGDAVRRGRTRGLLTENGAQNHAAWMYLGWMFGAANHPTFYILPAFRELGLNRHASWIAVRSLVARPAGSWLTYDDLVNLTRYGDDRWLYGAMRFGYNHLLERIRAGDLPPASRLAESRTKVGTALTEANRIIALPAQRDSLTALANAVLAALPR